MNKKIIGIAGLPGSGKDTIADYLGRKYGAKKFVFSDLLKTALLVFLNDEEIGRIELINLGLYLRTHFGEDILSRGMRKKIDASDVNIIVLSGIRHEAEIDLIRSFQPNKFIYVKVDNPRVRWQRICQRNGRPDDNISFESFLKKEEDEHTVIGTFDFAGSADIIIDNNGSLNNLYQQMGNIIF